MFLRDPMQPKAGTITAPSLWRWKCWLLSSGTHRWHVSLLQRAGHSLTLNFLRHNPLPAVEQQSSLQFLVSKSCCCGMPSVHLMLEGPSTGQLPRGLCGTVLSSVCKARLSVISLHVHYGKRHRHLLTCRSLLCVP